MADFNIDLQKTSFSKESYEKVIDTEFKNLGIKSYISASNDFISIEEFFKQYNQLFYDIPIEGEINSHIYIAKKSGEYSNFDKDLEVIKALQEEITRLREENLSKDVEILKLQTGQDINTNITSSLL